MAARTSGKRAFAALILLTSAAAVLYLADRILQPVPVAAATATLGGLLAIWWRPGRLPWTGAGLVWLRQAHQ